MHAWLRRLRHDLLKPALWVARDLREVGRAPTPADREALRQSLLDLRDERGAPVTAPVLWAALRASAPADLPPAALDRFERVLLAAVTAVEGPAAPAALTAVLRLEPAFDELAQLLEPLCRK